MSRREHDAAKREELLLFVQRHPNTRLDKIADGLQIPRWLALRLTRELDLDGRLVVTGGGRKALTFRLPTILDH